VDFYSPTISLQELYYSIEKKADEIFNHDQSYEFIIHGQYTGTGGPHLHIGHYFEGTKKPGLYLKEEGLTPNTKTLVELGETSTNAINVKKNGALEKTVSLKI
jgi:hypothetical protein